jgi:hypothetical protein
MLLPFRVCRSPQPRSFLVSFVVSAPVCLGWNLGGWRARGGAREWGRRSRSARVSLVGPVAFPSSFRMRLRAGHCDVA